MISMFLWVLRPRKLSMQNPDQAARGAGGDDDGDEVVDRGPRARPVSARDETGGDRPVEVTALQGSVEGAGLGFLGFEIGLAALGEDALHVGDLAGSLGAAEHEFEILDRLFLEQAARYAPQQGHGRAPGAADIVGREQEARGPVGLEESLDPAGPDAGAALIRVDEVDRRIAVGRERELEQGVGGEHIAGIRAAAPDRGRGPWTPAVGPGAPT